MENYIQLYGTSSNNNPAIELRCLTDNNGSVNGVSSTKTINIATDMTGMSCEKYSRYFITKEGKRLITLINAGNIGSDYYNLQICVNDMEAIINAFENSEEEVPVVPYLQKYSYGQVYTDNYVTDIYANESGTVILRPVSNTSSAYSTDYKIIGLTKGLDTENIIGIKYKNEYFSKVQPQVLSAGGPDVRAGKTFIGWMGYPETGTMEVE